MATRGSGGDPGHAPGGDAGQGPGHGGGDSASDQGDARLAAARILARAINTGDLALLTAQCSPNLELDTQSMLEPIFGAERVHAYLATQLAIARAERQPWRAELASLAVEHPAVPGIVLLQGGTVQAFWAPVLGPDGRIARLFGYTRVPPPTGAVWLGEAPGAGAATESQADRISDLARQRAAFRASTGPLRFHGFCVSAQVAESWLKPRLDALREQFPGSETHLHVHDPIGAGLEALEAQASQVGRFGITAYPVICVERGGKVFRNGRAPQDLDLLIEEVRALLGHG